MIDRKDSHMLGIDLSNRKFGLDVLRSLAIIFVLMVHSDFSFLPEIFQVIIKIFTFDGVNIFFVLSGFLIGSILIKTIDKNDFKTRNLIQFWRNRWLRTLPPYYFVLILIFFIPRFFNFPLEDSYLNTELKIRYTFFLQNFISPHLGFFTESWSLAVEEWFYLLIPIACFILCTITNLRTKKYLVYIISAGILLPLLYRIYNFYITFSKIVDPDTYDYYFRYLVTTRIDGIMYGVLAAYIYYFKTDFWNRISKISFKIGLSIIILNQAICLYYSSIDTILIGYYTCCYSYSIFSLGVFLILPYVIKIKITNGFLYKSLTFISLISYSLYLINFSIISMLVMPEIDKLINFNKFFHLIFYWSLSILLSTLMFRLIEKPSMDLRKILFKKK